MPGLTGIVAFKRPSEGIGPAIDTMAGLMLHDRSYVFDKKLTHEAGIGSIDSGRGGSVAKVSEDERHILAFYGNLYDTDELLDKASIGQKTDIADLVFSLFRKYGAEGLCGLNGIYVAVAWDKRERRLQVINDRYGFRKLYYWMSGEKFVFSSEYKAISHFEEFPRKVDALTLANILTFGYALEDRTLFENIKAVPAASIITVADGRLSARKYWDYSFFEEGDARLSEDDYIDAFAEKITRAVKKRVKGVQRLALPLSGGLDSRTVAAALDRINGGGFIKAYSHGSPGCYDVRFGRRIASALGLPHSTDTLKTDFIKEYSLEFQYLTEGSAACDWAWEIEVQKKEFSKDRLSHVISGFFGDVLCGSDPSWSRLLRVRDHDQAVSNIYERYIDCFSEEELSYYLDDKVYGSVRGRNYEIIRKTYFGAPTENILNRARYVNLTQTQRRFGSTMLDRYELFTDPLAPFTENEFVDFMLHVPVELEVRQSLYKKMLIRHFPKVVKVGHSSTGIPIKPARWQEGLRWRVEKWRPALKRLSLGMYGRKDLNDYRNAAQAIRKGSRGFVLEAFRDSGLKNEFFKSERLDELVRGFLSNGSNQYEKVCYPLTFFVWAEAFLKKGFHSSFKRAAD